MPVREIRGALVRPFASKGIDLGLNVFIASGYGGQTLETLALAGEGARLSASLVSRFTPTSPRRSPSISAVAADGLARMSSKCPMCDVRVQNVRSVAPSCG